MRDRLALSHFALLFAVLLVGSCVVGVGTAQTQYSMDVEGSIDTPDRTVTVEGQSFDVTETVRVQPGTSITVHTTGSSEEFYRVNLRNNQRQLEDYRNTLSGDETSSFSTESMPPGSYVLTLLNSDKNVVEIQPVVVSGYEVSLAADDEISAGSETALTVNLEANQDAPELDSVEVVIDGASNQRLTATKTGDGTYEATTTLEESGDYDVFAVVQGTDTYNGENELLGLSDVNSVSVTSGSQTGGGGVDDSTATATATASTPTTTTAPSETTTTTAEPTTNDDDNDVDNGAAGGGSTTSTTTPSETTSQTAEPTTLEMTAQTPNTTSTTAPLQAVPLIMLVGVVIGAVYRARRL